ncbi:MAG: hypothetical protein R3A51_10580 [Nannocystaceae bacterium]|nr:hypothetical protein [Myxococcales bacterium]
MGFRAHFALRDRAGVRLFASHWGGYRLLRDLLHGPEAFLAYVVTRRPADELYYGDAVDAVALIDTERKALRFWGGDNLNIESSPPLRRAYLTALGRRWPGWEVLWAPGGIYELADALERPLPEPAAFHVAALLDDALARDDGQPATVITLLDDARVVHDRSAGLRVEQLLTLGPTLVCEALSRPPASLPRERLPDPDDDDARGHGGLILDARARVVECWWSYPSPTRVTALPLLARFWPGWTVSLAADGLVRHVDRTGRPRARVELPVAEVAQALEARLFTPDVDLVGEARAAFDDLAAQLAASPGATLSHAAGARTDDAGLPPPTRLRGQIASLLRDD